MKLTRFEMAAVKRTAQNTKSLVKTKAKLNEKIVELASQIADIDTQIAAWEKPIMDKWGATSAQIIAADGVLPEEEATDPQENGIVDVTPVFGE